MEAFSPRLKALVQGIADLPTLPMVFDAVNRMVEDPHSTAESVGKAIATDPAIAAKVLRLVNSAFYGFPGRVATIPQSIVILGFSTIRYLVLTTAVMRALGEGRRDGFDPEEFWLHSIGTGTLARGLARAKDLPCREEAFMAGLLHDLGKLALRQFLPEAFARVLAYREERDCALREAEIAVLGFDHGEVGGWLAEKWRLPRALVDVIRYHHRPGAIPAARPAGLDLFRPPEAGGRGRDGAEVGYLDTDQARLDLTALVHAANILCRAMDIGSGGDGRVPVMDERVWRALDWREDELAGFMERCAPEVERAKVFLQLV